MNPAIEMLDTEVLSDNWYVLRKFTYRIRRADGTWATHVREAYDRGNGATILLYDTARRVVLLTRQFRLPTYVNGNPTGMMIEACAGLLEAENPDVRIRLELREETGYEVPEIRKVFEAYMSPGSVTEILHFYVAEYSQANRVDTRRRHRRGRDRSARTAVRARARNDLHGRDQGREDHHAAAIRRAEPVRIERGCVARAAIAGQYFTPAANNLVGRR